MPAQSPTHPFAALGPPGPKDRALRALAALGYTSRGFVYLFVGVIALLSVWGTREPEGPRQALAELLRAPGGRAVLSLLGIGLTSYSAWRFCQSILDKDRRGRGLMALSIRLGFLVGCGTYIGLAVYAWMLAAGLSRGEDGQLRDWTKSLATTTLGSWLLGFLGACVLCMGIAQVVIGVTEGYKRRFTPAWHDRWIPRAVARLGLVSKAASFGVLGSLLIVAAANHNPNEEPRGLGGALRAVHDAPAGDALLTALAAGLCAYALYSFLMARYRDARW